MSGETPRVSCVIPALDDRALLARSLPPLEAELRRRAGGDELLVVDDTGSGRLAEWLAAEHPRVRRLVLERNVGFARALDAGVLASEGELIFAMNPDVVVRPGFLEPLVRALAAADVALASPRVLLAGDAQRPESLNALRLTDGALRVEALDPRGASEGSRPIPFAIGGACLARRALFVEQGFDALFAPFYWEDVDLCLRAWGRGERVLEVPESVVEHHHRGTIGRVVPEHLTRAAIERGRRLVLWKHAPAADAQDLFSSVTRDAVDAALRGEREQLMHLALALDELEALARSRGTLASDRRSLDEILAASDCGLAAAPARAEGLSRPG